MIYEEAVAWLYASQLHGIKLGLENIRRLAAALGVHAEGSGAPAFLHVAGTNGKGSVCAMLDAMQKCVASFHLRTIVTYLPVSRFWTFQWMEFGSFLVLTAVLFAFSLWWVRRH